MSLDAYEGIFGPWALICSNVEDWQNLAAELKPRRRASAAASAFYKLVRDVYVPKMEDMHNRAERRKRKEEYFSQPRRESRRQTTLKEREAERERKEQERKEQEEEERRILEAERLQRERAEEEQKRLARGCLGKSSSLPSTQQTHSARLCTPSSPPI